MFHWEVEELAGYALGKSEKEITMGINDGTLVNDLESKYGIGFDVYCKIIKDLLPFTPIVASAIMEENYHAFVRHDGNGASVMIVGQPCKKAK